MSYKFEFKRIIKKIYYTSGNFQMIKISLSTDFLFLNYFIFYLQGASRHLKLRDRLSTMHN